MEDNLFLTSKRMALDIRVSHDVINFTRSMDYVDKKCLNMIVMNLLACVRSGNRLVYPRNKGTKIINKKKLTVRRIIKAIDYLTECGLIINVIGNSSKVSENRTMSYIMPTEQFVSGWDTTFEYADPEMTHLNSSPAIILRDGDKNEMSYRRTHEVMAMEEVVHAINNLNAMTVITDGCGRHLVNIYSRIFNEDFDHGGRFFRADVLQLKHREQLSRLDIKIGGEPVVEIDYSNLHFRIAAALNGIDTAKLPNDVYAGVIDDYTNPVDRQIVKVAVNILFNARSESSALRAIQQAINKLSEKDKLEYKLGSCFTVVARIKNVYPEFIPFFCRTDSYGLVLQNWESKLAALVLERCVNDELPCLSVHDSFIVEWFANDTLVKFMKESFRELFGVDCEVPLKVMSKMGGHVMEDHK